MAVQPLTVLFAGLGSIGTRHLKNFAALCKSRGIATKITALRSSQRVLPQEVQALLAQQVETLPQNAHYDMAFITGPTHLHAQTLEMLKGRVGTFFIEKPIFENAAYDLTALGLGDAQKAYVAAPMRFTAVFGALKEKLRTLCPYSVRAICSSYLPSWRPAADYRAVYSAHRSMGGGVTLDLIHEWDYLADLFGLPQKVFSLRGQYSHLEIDSDDLSVYIAEYSGFLCEVHLDYFGRAYRRTAEFFCREGSLLADFGAGTLQLPDGTVENWAEDVNRRYEREMEYFLGYAQNGVGGSVNSPAHALEVLKTVLGG